MEHDGVGYPATYSSMADEELLSLARDPDNLTAAARTAVQEELGRRKLKLDTVEEISMRQIVPHQMARSEFDAKPLGRWDWVWPNVDTPEGAERATKQAFWAAILVTAVTIGLALLGAYGVGFVRALGFDASALFDGVLFGVIAFGLWKHSRLAAWSGLVLYSLERVYMWSTVGIKNPIIAAILILAFVGGVRGTSALYRFKRIHSDVSNVA
jgi:hypothetical protein